MLYRCAIGALATAAAVCLTIAGAQAFDQSKFPDLTGQWKRPPGIGNFFDGTNRSTTQVEKPPLTPEYQAIFEANRAEQAAGGQGTDPTYTCIPDGMPRAMNVIFPMEMVVMPKTTYIMIEYLSMLRRIFTDGRDFPEDFEPSFMGYSIGKWVDEDADGKYDVLAVETRLLKGPRAFDASGLPLHVDNKTIVKERIFLDKANPDLLHDEITTIDNALTRPWTIKKRYVRERNPIWVEAICAEGNEHVRIQDENYMRSADGYLMPAKKGQKPPDLRYFEQARK
ncbi:MAG: hypothetical protein QOG83_189 [Alphaproteobacteria bacterium]|nr:hypothetical protein [Alphaproteobacteria bacterium]